MAKKRKSPKRKGTRRKVSGIMPNKESLMLVAGAVGGLAAVGFLSSKLPATLDEKVKAGIFAIGGVLLAGQRNALLRGAGAGIAALGGYKLVNAFSPGTLPAISGSPYLQIGSFSQYGNNPQRVAIAGNYSSFPNNPQKNAIAGARNLAGAGIC